VGTIIVSLLMLTSSLTGCNSSLGVLLSLNTKHCILSLEISFTLLKRRDTWKLYNLLGDICKLIVHYVKKLMLAFEILFQPIIIQV